MNPDRWREVSRIYGAVLTRPPDARAAALDKLCAHDGTLRREVESLLAEDSAVAALDGVAAAGLWPAADLTGRMLGPYRLESVLGAGGMGQVYRAIDTRLNRTVAVKVLPSALADDAQFRARFEREAKSIAALNHPHICTLHDVGDEGGVAFLVMELVQGESLAARLERGSLAFEQALQTAVEIADALAAAHKHGIIHRDLKPGNVMLTKSGAKLLDFGLAKTAQGSGLIAQGPQSMLPTTPPAGAPLTAQGTILGTLQYMAPEQLEGKEADARTDIFAFGALAYELFTGQKAFEGKSQASLIGAIMHAEPPAMVTHQPVTPPALERLIRTCLAKDPDNRWQSAADLARELKATTSGPEKTAAVASRRTSTFGVAGAALAAVAVLAALAWMWVRPVENAGPRPVSKLEITGRGSSMPFIGTPDQTSVLSPDGTRIVYLGNDGTQLFVRALDSLDATAIVTGTVRSPFLSPDGQWVGFVDGIQLKRVPISGGAPIVIGTTDRTSVRGISWMPDNTIVFGTNNSANGLLRLSVEGRGAEPEILTTPDPAKGESDHVYPTPLPDGSGVIFTITKREGGIDAADIALFDFKSRSITTLLTGGSSARYEASGHLLYAAAGTLRAIGFDLRRRATSGAPITVVDSLRSSGNAGADYTLSAGGTLAYIPNVLGTTSPRSLVWRTRDGVQQPLELPQRAYAEPRISPDGAHIAVYCTDQSQDIWIVDVARPSLVRMTSEPSTEQAPVWIDNERIAFSSDRGPVSGFFNLWAQRWDATDRPERLTTIAEYQQFGTSLIPSANAILVKEVTPARGRRLMRLALTTPHDMRPVIETAFHVTNGEVSPDGQWLAFDSDRSGRSEVYVRPFAEGAGGERLVSSAGGTRPHWAGHELFFVAADTALMSVTVGAGREWSATAPAVAAPPGFYVGNNSARFEGRHYDVSRDGQRILLVKPESNEVLPSIVVVQELATELRRKLARS